MQGHIHKRVHSTADGRTTTTWYVVVEVGRGKNGRRRQKWHGGYRTRREAEAVRAKLVNDIHRGIYIVPTKTTLAEWVADAWLIFAKTRIKASTFDSYRRTLDLHILPRIGGNALSDITTPMLNQLYAELLLNGRRNGGGGGLSNRSVRYVHAIIRKVLADAIDAGLIAINPAALAKPPRAVRSAAPTMNFWTAAELARFLSRVNGHEFAMAFRLLVLTGMRRGEVLGLRWDDVDFDGRSLSVRHALVVVGYAIREEAPKSHQARVIDLDRDTIERLRLLEAQQVGTRESDNERHRSLVIATNDGSPVHPDRLTKSFDQQVRLSGLRRIRLHDLRHTHATLALRAGAPVKVISERLGHESPAFTLTQYAHVMPGMQAEAAALIAELIQAATSDDPDDALTAQPGPPKTC